MKKIIVLFSITFLIFSCGNKEEKKVVPKTVPQTEEIIEEEIFVESEPEIVFTVQIAALQKSNSEFESLEGVNVFKENGLNKYRLGNFKSYKEANDFKATILYKYSDAFIQALKNESPININEALNN